MVHEKKIVEEVSGWLRFYDDGSVDWTWNGPPEVSFMAKPVMPHDTFADGVAVKDIDMESRVRVCIYLKEKKNLQILKLCLSSFIFTEVDFALAKPVGPCTTLCTLD